MRYDEHTKGNDDVGMDFEKLVVWLGCLGAEMSEEAIAPRLLLGQ
jgi:hypothetical protein